MTLTIESVVQFFLIIGGTYAFVLIRENMVKKEIGKLWNKQDEIVHNYVTRLDGIKDAVFAFRDEMKNDIHAVENGLRESNHTLATNMAKAVASLQTEIAKLMEIAKPTK